MLREKPRMGDVERRRQGVEIVNENKNKEKSEKESKRDTEQGQRRGYEGNMGRGEINKGLCSHLPLAPVELSCMTPKSFVSFSE